MTVNMGWMGFVGVGEAAEVLRVRARAFTLPARMASHVLSAHVTYSGRRCTTWALDVPAGAASDRSLSGRVSLHLGAAPADVAG